MPLPAIAMKPFSFALSPLRSALLAAVLCLPGVGYMAGAQAQLALPSMGDGADLTASEERRLGDSIIASLYRDPDYIDDPQLHAYVLSVWEPLVKAARERGNLSEEISERFAWEILLGRDKSINAFALPGGYLGVHLGLIGAVSSSDELATVMAHELTHVTQRHIARMFGQEKKNMPIMIASMVLGALAASKSPDAANALIVGGQAATIQNQLGFSRDMEREADRIGYTLLEPAGFAPQGAVSMFEKLQHASRLNDNGSWPYLRTHPLTTERIADMHSRVPQGKNQPPQPTLEHALMAGRARVLSRPGIDTLRQWVKFRHVRQLDPLAQSVDAGHAGICPAQCAGAGGRAVCGRAQPDAAQGLARCTCALEPAGCPGAALWRQGRHPAGAMAGGGAGAGGQAAAGCTAIAGPCGLAR